MVVNLRSFRFAALCFILLNAAYATFRMARMFEFLPNLSSSPSLQEILSAGQRVNDVMPTSDEDRATSTSPHAPNDEESSLSQQLSTTFIIKETHEREKRQTPNHPQLEFVHIPKTGGSAIEYAAAKANITWGLCHWKARPKAGPGCHTADWLKYKVTQNLDYENDVEYSWEIWHTPPSWLKKNSPYQNKSLFAVVRDPYERFLSEFYCPYNGLNPVDWTLSEEDRGFVDPMATPIEDAKKLKQKESKSQPPTRKPETPETLNKFLMDRLRFFTKWTAHYLPQADFVYDEHGKQVVQHVLKYENLTAEFDVLMKGYELPLSLNERTNAPKQRRQRMTVADLYPETIKRINEVAAKDFSHFGYQMLNPQDQSKNAKKSSTTNTSSTSLPMQSNHSTPSIAFLFMTTHELNEDLWERWFPENDNRYSIFVHTVPSNTTVPLGPFFCRYAIPSLRTAWYDLHDGMMQVLRHAFDADKAAEHFVFVSATSIPLVSFDDMYDSLMVDGSKSRMCWGPHSNARLAWQLTQDQIPIDNERVRKAEMWSKLSRQHSHILLEQREVMDAWNKVFVDVHSKNGSLPVGAPDECFFPTMLRMKADPSEFQTCAGPNTAFTSLEDRCCTTQVLWQMSNSTVYVPDTNITLSDSCKRGWPCSFTSLYEEGLVTLQKRGLLFLRKVLPAANVTNVRNDTLPLNDAVLQLHAKKPMLPLAWNEEKAVGKALNFQCNAPQNA